MVRLFHEAFLMRACNYARQLMGKASSPYASPESSHDS